MENEKLVVQDAPEKNNDNAFVQVGTDGKPVVPQADEAAKNTSNDAPKQGTLADR